LQKILITDYDVDNLIAKFSIDKYYFTLYDENSLNIVDLIQNNAYNFNIKAKKKSII